jgi:hypothetical protein
MKGRWTVQVRLADRFDAIWFESIYDVNYFWIRFFWNFKTRRKKSCHDPMTPQTLLPILEEPWFSDPRKSNAPDALDEYARLKSAYLSPLVNRSKENRINENILRYPLRTPSSMIRGEPHPCGRYDGARQMTVETRC